MRNEYDFSDGKPGAVASGTGKVRITIMLDPDVIAHFRSEGETSGCGYQTLINAALRERISDRSLRPVNEGRLREILREELRAA